MTRTVSVFFGAFLMVGAAAADAQTGDLTSNAPWWQFDIRKGFDGASGNDEPASVGLVSPGRESQTYWLLDGGVRLKPQSFHFGEDSGVAHAPLVIWYPSFEWHHMSAEPLAQQEATNAGGGAINAELWLGDPDSPQLKVYLLGKGAITRDVLNGTTAKSLSILAGLFQAPEVGVDGGFRPGSPIVFDGYRRAQYFPYFGVEYFRQLAITQGAGVVAPLFDGADGVLRIDFETMPFHHETIPGNIRFVISGQYAYRRLFKAADVLDSRNMQFLNIEAAYYFVTDRKVGLAVSLDNGRAPSVNFVTQRRVAFVLKTKI
jgi:hypothetical protein